MSAMTDADNPANPEILKILLQTIDGIFALHREILPIL
jgi:hypothetical protein